MAENIALPLRLDHRPAQPGGHRARGGPGRPAAAPAPAPAGRAVRRAAAARGDRPRADHPAGGDLRRRAHRRAGSAHRRRRDAAAARGRGGTTVVIVTHEPEVTRFCDRAVFLYAGQVDAVLTARARPGRRGCTRSARGRLRRTGQAGAALMRGWMLAGMRRGPGPLIGTVVAAATAAAIDASRRCRRGGAHTRSRRAAAGATSWWPRIQQLRVTHRPRRRRGAREPAAAGLPGHARRAGGRAGPGTRRASATGETGFPGGAVGPGPVDVIAVTAEPGDPRGRARRADPRRPARRRATRSRPAPPAATSRT